MEAVDDPLKSFGFNGEVDMGVVVADGRSLWKSDMKGCDSNGPQSGSSPEGTVVAGQSPLRP